MDLRTWTDNPVKSESKKKIRLAPENDDAAVKSGQIERAAEIYHVWQSEGTDGRKYEEPELYRSVGIDEIEKKGWSLAPSKYIEFIDHDFGIDYSTEMARIQKEMRNILTAEKESQKLLKDAFKGIGYGIDEI